METEVALDSAYKPSDDVVARDIEGELIIVPLAAGIGDMEDEIYTLNKTGQAIWSMLDGKKTLREVALALGTKFEAKPDEIQEDVAGLVGELFKRKIVVRA